MLEWGAVDRFRRRRSRRRSLMSQQQPRPDESAGEFEYLGETRAKPSGRRWALIAGGTATVVAFGAVGAWGVTQFLGGGPAPATAVPADALAYVAVDLDPSGGQKLAAYETLKKFPA